MKYKLLLVGIISVIIVALLVLLMANPFSENINGYRYTTEGNSLLNDVIDTRLVVSGFPEGDIIRGDVHNLRFYFQTLGMGITSGEAIASPFGNLAILIGYHLHRGGLTGPLMALGAIPSDYCVKYPLWALDFGQTANIPGTYYLEVWSDIPTAGVAYEDQSMTLTMVLK
jgi:hypothetical protein